MFYLSSLNHRLLRIPSCVNQLFFLNYTIELYVPVPKSPEIIDKARHNNYLLG